MQKDSVIMLTPFCRLLYNYYVIMKRGRLSNAHHPLFCDHYFTEQQQSFQCESSRIHKRLNVFHLLQMFRIK